MRENTLLKSIRSSGSIAASEATVVVVEVEVEEDNQIMKEN